MNTQSATLETLYGILYGVTDHTKPDDMTLNIILAKAALSHWHLNFTGKYIETHFWEFIQTETTPSVTMFAFLMSDCFDWKMMELWNNSDKALQGVQTAVTGLKDSIEQFGTVGKMCHIGNPPLTC